MVMLSEVQLLVGPSRAEMLRMRVQIKNDLAYESSKVDQPESLSKLTVKNHFFLECEMNCTLQKYTHKRLALWAITKPPGFVAIWIGKATRAGM